MIPTAVGLQPAPLLPPALRIPGGFRAPFADPRIRTGSAAIRAVNFCVAAMQTGFGPFITVWLVSQGWSLTQVGVVLSVGTIAALGAQLPAGMLVDALRRNRDAAAVALAVMAFSALLIADSRSAAAIWVAEVLHSVASAVIALAIAALTLSMRGQDSFSDRLGRNARYASLGSALAAVAFGLASAPLGEQSIFFITAGLALPAIACLFVIKPTAQIASGDAATDPHRMSQSAAVRSLFHDPAMLVFAVCVCLFQLGNAALLPLVLGELSQHGENLNFIVPATIIVPQFIVATASPWAGAMARHIGRRAVLLTGFIALPMRALLFAFDPWPEAVVVIQVLDGISATVVGLMLPLIAADLTRKTGRMNLAIGSFGLTTGLGATFSTTVAGWVADRMGGQMAFLGLALVGVMAATLLAVAMPETRSKAEAREAEVSRQAAAQTPVPDSGTLASAASHA